MNAQPEQKERQEGRRRSLGSVLMLAVLSVPLLGVVDYATGYELGFFVFYFIPVAGAAWYAGPRSGYAVAVLSAVVWYLSDHYSQHEYSSRWFQFWNTFIRMMAFIAIGYATAHIRRLLDRERTISAELQDALDHVKTLRGMLPICASCKKIRDDQGYWQRIEEYLSEHTDVQFTHGLCRECAVKYLRDAGLDADNLPEDTGGKK